MAKSFFNEQDRLLHHDKKRDARYTSVVHEVNSPILVISEPVSTSDGALVMKNGEVKGFELMSGDAIYTFDSKILERMESNPPTYRIEHPRSARRRQRRQYYRLDTFLDVEYEIVKKGESHDSVEDKESDINDTGDDKSELPILVPEDSGIHENLSIFEEKMKDKTDDIDNKDYAFTVDISGGGIQLVLSRYIRPDSELLMKINLPDVKGGIMARGKIIRCFSIQVGVWKKYRAAIAFVKIDEKSRDSIIKFIFDKTRKRVGQ